MFDSIIQGLLGKAELPLYVILLVVISMNVLLTALKKILEKIKDQTAWTWDNALYDVIVKILGFLALALEFATANSSRLPAKVQDELKKGSS